MKLIKDIAIIAVLLILLVGLTLVKTDLRCSNIVGTTSDGHIINAIACHNPSK